MTLDVNSNLTLTFPNNYSYNIILDPYYERIDFGTGIEIDNAYSDELRISNSTGNIAFNPDAQTIVFSSGLTINGSASSSVIYYAGDSGFVGGNGVSASGWRSAAFGGNASASGNSSVALVDGTASGFGAVGVSEGVASGNWSVSMIGGNVTVNATDGLAIGSGAYSNATAAMALGNGTTALAWSSLTVGHYNANITGNSTAWAATDPAFIVGVGNGTGNLSANGLVVLNNGNTTLGKSNASVITILGDTTLGNDTTTTTTVTGNLAVSGNVTGNVTLTGNVTVTQPQGDIPMGAYGN